MGVDVGLSVRDSIVKENESLEAELYSSKFNLSRTFGYLLCRKDVVSDEPELDQICRKLGIDVRPIHQMQEHCSDWIIEETLMSFEFEMEKATFLKNIESMHAKLEGNIKAVSNIIDSLLGKLSQIERITDLLDPTYDDTVSRETYFQNFTNYSETSNVVNHFGQDIFNFKRFIDFAKSKNYKTVVLEFG